MITTGSYTQPDNILLNEVGVEVFLLDVESERYYSLNKIGATIYSGLVAGKSLNELTETLLTEFDVDKETLRNDIETLVTSLVSQGLLVSSDASL